MNKKKIRILLTVVTVFLTLIVMGLIQLVKSINSNITDFGEVKLEEEYPEAWEELGDSLRVLEFGNFFGKDGNGGYVITVEFKKAFHKIYNGYYANTSDEQIYAILLDKMPIETTFDLDAGEVYSKLKPTEGVTIETYLAEIDAKIAESKTYSAQLGYKIGDKTTTKGGVEFIYQGNNKWVDKDGIVHIPVKHEDGSFHFEEENKQVADNTQNNNSSSSNKNNSSSSNNTNKNSKYVSEQWGYKKGDTAQTTADGVYTYLGNDIWQSADGTTYKARLVGSNIEFFSKSPYGVSSVTDEEGYLLADTDDTPEEDPDKDSRDPSGWRVGSVGWHGYWDGKTVKEFEDTAGYRTLYYCWDASNPLNTIDYPDDYVIGSYALIYKKFPGTGTDIYGEY